MENNSYHFHLPAIDHSIIKVMGIGGGGSNAVNHMYTQGIRDVEFIVCNTDKQALGSSPVSRRLQIGTQLTGGLGVGACPEKGAEAAQESKEEIESLLKEETKMLFITAGMGGGTGTGAAPAIAQMAKDMGILTVGIVTLPFHWEGPRKMKRAQEGVEKLRACCDTVLVVLNEKLKEIYKDISVRNAFAKANDVLTTAARGIAEIITVPGEVNVDFEDVNTVIRGAGDAVMGSATAVGENRALEAIEKASSSPLLNNQHVYGAKKILLSITCGNNPEMGMEELDTITEYVQSKVGEDAEFIFGNSTDPQLGDQIAVTLIATTFSKSIQSTNFEEEQKRVYDLDRPQSSSPISTPYRAPESEEKNGSTPFSRPYRAPESEEKNGSAPYEWAQEKVEGSPPSDHFFEIEEHLSANSHREAEDVLEELEGAAHPLSRKHTLMEEKDERVRVFKGVKNPNDLDSETFKDKLEKPAYLRRKVLLPEMQPSTHRNLSRFYLDAEDKLLGKNKFLYDNVD